MTTARDILADGAQWLDAQLRAHASQYITYIRGPDQLALSASLGRKLFQLSDGEGDIVVEWTDKDFIVTAADLTLNGAIFKPQRGDLIEIVIAGATQTYEVLAPGGETPWQYCDPYQTTIRIHSKMVRTT